MNKYTISFVGRTKNALGVCYRIMATVEAESKELAILALYDTYEHISMIDFV